MDSAVKDILDSFDRLPEDEKREIASEIIRRTLNLNFPNITDEELIYNAEEIFLELDKRESTTNE